MAANIAATNSKPLNSELSAAAKHQSSHVVPHPAMSLRGALDVRLSFGARHVVPIQVKLSHRAAN